MIEFLPLKKSFVAAAFVAVGVFSASADDSFPEYNVSPDDVVTEQPAGELKIYERDGIDYRAYLGGVEEGAQTGMEMRVVFDEDGKTIWFYNILSTAQDCFSWVKGTLEDGVVTIPEGTPMWCFDYQTHITAYILCNLKPGSEDKEGTTDAFECIRGNIQFSYVNGDFKLLPNDSGVAAIGLQRYSTDSFIIEYGLNYKWLGYADRDSSYVPFNDVPNAGPSENAEINPYTFTYKDAPWSDEQTYLVDVAIEDSKFFIRGIGAGLGDEYWAVANFDGDKAVFPSKQYFGGIREGYDTFLTYLCAARIIDDQYLDFADSTVFDYNAEDGSFRTDGALMFNVGDDNVIPAVLWTEISMAPFVEKPVVPANPIIIEDYTDDPYEEGAGRIMVEIPNEDVDGTYIRPDNLSYMIYVDGEPFTFDPDVYFGFEEPMTEIPYYFSDGWDIGMESNSVRIIRFYGGEPESIGVQSICTVDGVVNKSDIVPAETSSVVAPEMEKEIESVKFYNMDGQSVEAGFKGIVVRVVTYSDGSTERSKVLNR